MLNQNIDREWQRMMQCRQRIQRWQGIREKLIDKDGWDG